MAKKNFSPKKCAMFWNLWKNNFMIFIFFAKRSILCWIFVENRPQYCHKWYYENVARDEKTIKTKHFVQKILKKLTKINHWKWSKKILVPKNVQCSETYEKTIFWFLFFLRNGRFCAEFFQKIDHNIATKDIVKIWLAIRSNTFQKILWKWK